MPRLSLNKLYSAGAKQAELIELCRQRGLPLVKPNGGKLTNEQLKRQLDDYAAAHEESPYHSVEEDAFILADAEDDRTGRQAIDENAVSVVNDEGIDISRESPNEKVVSTRQSRVLDKSSHADLFSSGSSHVVSSPPLFITNPGVLEGATSEETTSAALPSSETNGPRTLLIQEQPTFSNEVAPGSNEKPFTPPQAASEGHVNPAGPYYLLLSHGQLGTSLSRGIFIPVALDPDPALQRQRSGDLLSQYPDCLPLSLGRFATFSDQDVLVELTLLPSEIKRLVQYGSIYTLGEPLPVSRIRSLTFTNEDAFAGARADALTYKNFFLPQQQTRFLSDGATVPLVELPTNSKVNTSEAADATVWRPRLHQIDQQLGLFGYLKHAPLLSANATQAVQDYPAEFQYALSLLNRAVATPPPATGSEWLLRTLLRTDTTTPNTPGRRLLSALVDSIYAGVDASFSWASQLLVEVVAQTPANEKNHPGLQDLRETQRQIDLLRNSRTNYQDALAAIARGGRQSIPQAPFAAVILLIKFPNRDRGSTDKQAVLDVLGKAADREAIASPQLEWLLAILGLYYTYSRLTREDPNLNIRNEDLAALAQPLHRLRFNVDLFADRVVIETVFRFATEGQVLSDTLTYLGSDQGKSTTIELPLRAAGTPPAGTLFDTSAKPAAASDTKLTPSEDLRIYQSVLRKTLALFAPDQFERLLLPSFTPAEQAILRQLLAPKKQS